MIGHLVTLIWNRRRANALILIELVAAFLVLAGLGTAAAYHLDNARRPLGYDTAPVWAVSVGHGIARREGVPEAVMAEAMATTKHLLETARDLPEVEAAATALTGPILQGMRNTEKSDDPEIPPRGRGLIFDVDNVSDDFARVMGLQVLRGRWFGREDDGAAYEPAVINDDMARDFFGDADPLGQQVGSAGAKRPVRVVGVVAGYRQRGDLSPPVRYMFRRYIPGHAWELPYHRLLIKTRAGTGAAFEATLGQRLRAIASSTWSFGITRLDEARKSRTRFALVPLKAVAIVAGFLILMVVLGLTGVLWQNVAQRTKEIGLRRAKGATGLHIHGQILGELMILSAIAIALGSVLVVHVPLLGLVEGLAARVYLQGLAAGAVVVLLIISLCGTYPAWMAARVQPALALRDE
jgi:putative ABC transport system permease protein